MILSCPTCSAQFVVDPAALGAKGRKVRCGKCSHQWHATPPLVTLPAEEKEAPRAPQEVKPIPAGTRHPVMAKLPVMAKKEKEKPDTSKRNALFAAVLLAALLSSPVLVMASAKFFRGPQTGVETAAVKLDGVPRTLLKEEQGRTVLSVSGVLINSSARKQPVPVLKAQALNAKRGVVREWVMPLSTAELEPGQRLPFIFTTPFSEQGVVDIGFKFSEK